LASALSDALGATAQLEVMGAESRAIVVREFAWPAVADRLVALYDEVLSDRESGPAVR
jgi:glycosyltransferase involved in cell wall biosynthesis